MKQTNKISLTLFILIITTSVSFASAKDDSPRSIGVTGAGLHGVHRVGVPAAPTKHFTASGQMGYGFTEKIAPIDGSHHRLSGRFGLGVAPIRWLSLRLNLDGYYDWHPEDQTGKKDTTGMGNPTFLLRGGFAFEKMLQIGAEVDFWVPGKEAPSLDWGATTISPKLLFALSPKEQIWTIATHLGFRIDNSAEAAPDDPRTLRSGDRISLGLSDFHAVLIGLGSSIRLSKLELLAELTFDLLIGDGAPTGKSPMRISIGGRYHFLDSLRLELLTDTVMSGRPGNTADDSFAPIEPRFGLHLGLAYTFAFGKKPLPEPKPDPVTEPEPDPVVQEPIEEKPSEPPQTTALSGHVVDADGNPLGGIDITLTINEQVFETKSGSEGEYSIPDVPVGQGTLKTTGEEFEETETTVEVTKDMPPIQSLTLLPKEAVESSQLRGQILSFKGKPVRAKITVNPGGIELETDDDGSFRLDLPAGQYKVLIRAKGYRHQTRKVEIEENSVTILNADVRRRKN